MSQEKYIGMDVHQATISVAVMDGNGKLLMECLLETKAATILAFVQGLRNLIFQAEVVEQRFRAVVLPHHDQQASDDRNQTKHGRMLPSNMLLLNLILPIDVTFSTPTPVYINYQRTVSD